MSANELIGKQVQLVSRGSRAGGPEGPVWPIVNYDGLLDSFVIGQGKAIAQYVSREQLRTWLRLGLVRIVH